MKLSSPDFRSPRFFILALIALTCAVYSNSLLNGFTIDDEFVYSDNHFTKRLQNIQHLFDSAYFQYSNEASYRPVCTLTYFLDRAVWGDWKMGPHVTNLVMYVGIVLIVFQFGTRLTRSPLAGFLGAALFAIHPIHTEVVNNVSFREDLLMGLLVPTVWLLYKRAETARPWLWIPLAWLCYFLSLFSKEMAVMFPALFVLVEWAWSDEPLSTRLTRRNLLFMAGVIVCTIFFVLVRFHWMRFTAEAHGHQLGGSLFYTLVADVKIMAKYLLLFTFPHPLRALYPPAAYAPHFDTRFFISLGGLLVMTGFLAYFRRVRFFVFGLLWWFICLVPVANIEPIFNPMAERYLFLPSIGICIWIGWIAARALNRPGRFLAIATMGVAAVSLSVATLLRNPDWKDNLSLWTATDDEVPNDARVLANLATAHYHEGEYAQALHEAERALELDSTTEVKIDRAPVYLCLGSSYAMQNQMDIALQYMLEAEKLLPVRFDIDSAVLRNIAVIYDERNDLRTAAKYYERAAAVDPFRAELWRKLSFCQLRMGNRTIAQKSWAKARNLDPTIPTFEEIEDLIKNAQPRPPAPSPEAK